MAQGYDDLTGHATHGLGYLKRAFKLLDRLRPSGTSRDAAGNRKLFFDGYAKLVLLYTWNPMLDSVRDLQAAVGLPAVARALGVNRFSLGSFSESVRAFDPGLLKGVVAELAGGLRPLPNDPRLSQLKSALTAVDGTVLAALPRLAKAAAGVDADGVPAARFTTGRDGKGRYGWRLHAELDLATFAPGRLTLTGARNAGANREHNVLRAGLAAGKCYVGDGGYADAALFDAVVAAGSNFVFRTRADAVFDVVEERPLTDAALAVGVVRDAVVRLGPAPAAGRPDERPLRRLVAVQVEPHPRRTRKGTKDVDLIPVVTDLLHVDADLVALVYEQRYTVELFFRFLKQLLGLRHLISQRREGLEVQVYCAVIVTLLLLLTTGRKPDRATTRMVGWYLLGVATEADLLAFLNRPDNTGVKKRAKDELWKKLGVA